MIPLKAEVGKQYAINMHKGDRHTVVDILLACEKNNGYWFCLEHDEGFQNQLQKDIHMDSKEKKKDVCKFAWVCWEHGFETP